MKVTITFLTDDDAFKNNPEAEVRAVLAQAAVLVDRNESGGLRDTNGNPVGNVDIRKTRTAKPTRNLVLARGKARRTDA